MTLVETLSHIVVQARQVEQAAHEAADVLRGEPPSGDEDTVETTDPTVYPGES